MVLPTLYIINHVDAGLSFAQENIGLSNFWSFPIFSQKTKDNVKKFSLDALESQGVFGIIKCSISVTVSHQGDIFNQIYHG
jgi:hypothetical protein